MISVVYDGQPAGRNFDIQTVMMTDGKLRRLILLTDDNFLAEALGTYMRSDSIAIERVSSTEEAAMQIAAGADGVVIDLAKRGMNGDAVVMLSFRAQRWKIPMMILSSQPRRDVADFGEVVRATDVVSKTEAMTAIAARVRLCVRTPIRGAKTGTASSAPFGQVNWVMA
jgi:DNA-binding response OmpR family regulator